MWEAHDQHFTVYWDVLTELPPARRACKSFDSDGDEDIDQSDFGRFQACFTNGLPETLAPECEIWDFDCDGQVGREDLLHFLECRSGASQPADEGCLCRQPIWSGGPWTFDGTNDVVNLPAGIVSGLYDFTVAARVNVAEVRAWQRIFDFGSGTAVTMCMTPHNDAGQYAFAIKNGEGTEQWIRAAGFTTGTWRHVGVTLQGSTGILYLDGVEAGRNAHVTLAPAFLGETSQNYLGASQFEADPLFKGTIESFRIYDRALTAGEMKALADEAAGG